ncbi:hypothetical protein [Actinokineospora iranica]|uniref:Uncharacterized protein n=1 Tax=Actinokineospora iranica TaxID=1271860 RepID=A0A1G6RJM0_9PSEU|nr:hypothetical protein SAMN05216174_106356 [Actinokineospora iranica]
MSATRPLVLGLVTRAGKAPGHQVRTELMGWRADGWARVKPRLAREGLRRTGSRRPSSSASLALPELLRALDAADIAMTSLQCGGPPWTTCSAPSPAAACATRNSARSLVLFVMTVLGLLWGARTFARENA